MGYDMSQRESKFKIKAENMPLVLNTLNLLSEQAPYQPRGHFAFVDTPTLFSARTVEEQLKEWRWDPEFDNQGNIVELNFSCERLGDDKLLFDTLAPFVEAGSFINMTGEEGDVWRWYFTGAECLEQDGTVQYPAVPGGDIIDVVAKDVTEETRPGRLLPNN